MRDLRFGICGLDLNDPDEARRVSADRAESGYDVTESDWVIGEFIGDTDMLILDNNNNAVISTGSYAREFWHTFTSLEDVLRKYIEYAAEKYWERDK